MRLYEYEGKMIFRASGIETPHGMVVSTLEQAEEAAAELGYPVVLKGQVLRGGRGRAGAIGFARNKQELVNGVNRILNMHVDGEKVVKLLIEEKLRIVQELYLGITLDPNSLLPLLMVSVDGGVDIEEILQDHRCRLLRAHLDPLDNMWRYQALDLLVKAGLRGEALLKAAGLVIKLVQCYFKYDAVTAEINPLVITDDGTVLAADAKIEVDDSALFRLKVACFARNEEVLDPLEAEAKALGISCVRIGSGDVGVIAGGAGIGMASMDMISAHGGMPSNFLDLGGDATRSKISNALRVVLKIPGVKGVLVNVFGGINNCEEMAEGVAEVICELRPVQIIVVKMRGHSQEEGWAILENVDLHLVKYGTTEEAVVLLLQEMRKAGW